MRHVLLSGLAAAACGCSLLLGEGLSGGDEDVTPAVDAAPGDGGATLAQDGGDAGCPGPTCAPPDASPCDGPCGPVLVATDETQPDLSSIRDLAADDAMVVWAESVSGRIRAADSDGTKVRTVIETRGAPVKVLLTSTEIFWSQPGQGVVGRIARDAVNAPPAATLSLPDARHMAFDGADLFILSDSANPSLHRAPRSLASSTVFVNLGAQGVSGGWLVDLAVDATYVYGALSGDINQLRRFPRSGGNASALGGSLADVRGCTADDTRVYVTSGSDGVVRGSAKVAGSENIYASGDPNRPRKVAVHGSHVYWTDARGLVVRAAKAGGAPEVLATGQPSPTAIAVNERAIYWVTEANKVMMLRKP